MGRPLVESNRYLRDPVARRRALLRSVATSSAIEGIRAPFRDELAKEKIAELAATRKLKGETLRGESSRSQSGKPK